MCCQEHHNRPWRGTVNTCIRCQRGQAAKPHYPLARTSFCRRGCLRVVLIMNLRAADAGSGPNSCFARSGTVRGSITEPGGVTSGAGLVRQEPGRCAAETRAWRGALARDAPRPRPRDGIEDNAGRSGASSQPWDPPTNQARFSVRGWNRES